MRLPRLLFVVPVLVLAAAPAVRSAPQTPVQVTPIPGEVPVRWGLVLECEQPFYPVGDTLHARFVLANGSADDAASWSLMTGGNGCNYRFELVDAAGRTVWEAGSVVAGQFQPPACLFGGRASVLPGRSQVQARAALPLVYQNAEHLGPQGSPLPAGHYQLVVEVSQFGPERPPASFTGGLTYSARVPVLVE
jgi:hypothetical protein